MADSANLAVYMIALSRDFASREQLDQAMTRAVTHDKPLERVLVEAGVLSPQQVVELREQRSKMGRRCAACSEVTYVLPDEKDKPCESCGKPLPQPRRKKKKPEPAERRPRRPRPSQDASGEGSSVSRRTARVVLDRRMGEVEEKLRGELGDQVAEAVENRLAQLDLEGLREQVVAEATAAFREELPRQLLKAETLSALQAHLSNGGGGGGGAPASEEAVEDLTNQALARVSERVDSADLSGLFQRVAEGARELLSSEGVGGGGDPALAGRVDALETRTDSLGDVAARLDSFESRLEDMGQGSGSGGGAELVVALNERVSELEQALAALSELSGLGDRVQDLESRPAGDPELAERVAALESRPAGDPAGDSELAERVAALESRPAGDPELAERVAALETRPAGDPELAERVAALETRPAGDPELAERVAAVEGRPPDPALAERLHELEEAMGEAAEALAKLQDSGEDPEREKEIVRRASAKALQEVQAELGDTSQRIVQEALPLLREQVENLDLSERVDALIGELEQTVTERVVSRAREQLGHAAEELRGPVLEAIEQRIESLDLKTLPERVAGEARDRLGIDEAGLAALQTRLDQLEGQSGPDLSGVEARLAALEGQGGPDLSGVEARLAALEGQGGPDLSGVEARLAALEGQSGPDLSGVEARLAALEGQSGPDLSGVEARLAALEGNLGEGPSGEAIEVRLAALETGSGPDPEVLQRLEALEAQAAPDAALLERLEQLEVQVMSAGGPDPALQQRLETLEGQVGAGAPPNPALLQRVEQLEVMLATGGPPGGGGADPAQLAALNERLSALEEEAGDPGFSQADLILQNTLAAVEERLASVSSGSGGGGEGDGGLSVAEVEDIVRRLGVSGSGGGSRTQTYDKRFLQLAQKVKELKDLVEALERRPAPAPQPGLARADLDLILSSPDLRVQLEEKVKEIMSSRSAPTELVSLLNSAEFKQLFDQKVNQVLSYVKSDVVPRAVRQALEKQ